MKSLTVRNILNLDAGGSEPRLALRRNQSIGGSTMYRQFALALAASVLAVLAMPASAGTTQVSGIGVFNTECQPPVGSPPVDRGLPSYRSHRESARLLVHVRLLIEVQPER